MWQRVNILWGLLRGRRGMYAGAVAAILLSTGFMFLSPLIRKWAVDLLVEREKAEMPAFVAAFVTWLGGGAFVARNLWIAGAGMTATVALSGLLAFLKARWSAVASEAVVRSLRERLYDHLQHLPCGYHDRKDTGDLVQRCSSDVETLRMFLAVSLVEVGRGVILLLIGVPLMVSIHPTMALASLWLMPVIIAYSVLFFVVVRKTFQKADEAEGEMTTVLEEDLTGIRVVRAFARGPHECERFERRNDEHRRRWYRVVRLFAVFWSASDCLCMLQIATVMVTGAHLMIAGRQGPGGLTPGGFFAFMTMVNMFMWPIRHMGRVLADFGKATVSLDRIQEVLREPREDHCAGDPAEAFVASGEIVVEDLRFAHNGSPAVLRGVSFRVAPGETVALLGPSGSGKSTLVNLLLRLYDYREGSIRLDGREIAQADRKHVRRQFGVVLQEPFLYSRSVGENIRLGGHGASEDAVAEAASMACVHDAIQEFDKGYETLVGERGVTLSGGQRQRVALARAILADPPILILDDALSAVDTQTEAMILGALRRRRGRRTTLLIAHRVSTLKQADRILVLEGGRIAQFGTHEQLVGAGGLYQRLWAIQSSLEEDLRIEAKPAGKGGTQP
ncbi:MAG TPA: ABC transporter ATP-binding protein [Phycisphaerae bacterium]|nr:ABC transporter ATP-binding protein [Phycisphaerae bacterium]